MNDSEDIRGLLADAPAPPPGVHLDAVLARGRRRLARRRVAELAGGASLVLVLVVTTASVIALRSGNAATPAGRPSASAKPAPATQAAPSRPARTCAVTALAIPAGRHDVEANAVDSSGRYIAGTASKSSEDYYPVLWTDGVPKVLPIPGESVEVDDVNSHGVAVGVILNNHYRNTTIFRYDHGAVTELRAPVASTWNFYPQPYIDDDGVIVINAEPPGRTGGENSVVIEWSPGATSGHLLDIPSQDDVNAVDGNRLGGGSYPGGYGKNAIVWDLDGKHARTLRTPDGKNAIVYDVSGDWAVGGFFDGRGATTAARWNLRTGEFDSPGVAVPLEHVNSRGWVAGNQRVDMNGTSATLEHFPGTVLPDTSFSISDNGIVVGTASDSHDNTVPLIWHC